MLKCGKIIIYLLSILIFISCESYHEEYSSEDWQKNNINEKKVVQNKSSIPLRSLVQLIITIGDKPISSGSGVVISDAGLIITNNHVIEFSYLSHLNIIVALNHNNAEMEPNEFYMANVLKKDKNYDLALLKIIRNISKPRVSSSSFIPIRFSNPNEIKLGQSITILGYPGLGRNTPTVTKGIVSGWLEDGHYKKGWIKTDAEINRGNSGGLAVNEKGELIGIPTVSLSDKELSGKISLIRSLFVINDFLK